jgi:uncharacterized protein (DUF1697 family)
VSRHVAFLRAVNVAGHARMPMVAVRDAFAAAGGAQVATYIQSGNVLFDARASDAAEIVSRACKRLAASFGERPEVMLRTLRHVAELAAGSPFAQSSAMPTDKLYVAFLARAPRLQPVLPFASEPERLAAIAIEGREVFIVSKPKKSGFFGMPNLFVEERLGVASTCRNWSTVVKLAKLSAEPRERPASP